MPEIPIVFYTETHIAKAVTEQLRAQGVQMVRAEEIGMADASDLDHLTKAAQEGWVLVTGDDDLLNLADQWAEEGRRHGGILFIQPEVLQAGERGIGVTVRTLLFFHEAVISGAATIREDFYNQVRYLSLKGWA